MPEVLSQDIGTMTPNYGSIFSVHSGPDAFRIAFALTENAEEPQPVSTSPFEKWQLTDRRNELSGWADNPIGEEHSIKGIPALKFPALQDPVLTDVVRKMIQRVWAIIVSKALSARLPLDETIVSIFEDPVTEQRRAVLHVHCHAIAPQALGFWNSLEGDFQSFLKTLKGNDKETFRRKLDLRIHWR